MIFTIIIFVLTLLVLVVIHESGHFLVAKKFNIKVLEFGFGIPPKAWGKKVGETLVSINWLPIGGFVRLLGEDEVNKQVLQNPRSFAARPVGERIAVVVAGVAMNLILAWLIFYIVLGFKGFKTQIPLLADHQFVGVNQVNESAVIIRGVVENSPAGKSGLKRGERIIAVNNQPVKDGNDLISKTSSLAGQEVTLILSNPDTQEQREVRVTPRKNPPAGQGAIGVSLSEFKVANLQYQTIPQKLLAGPVHSWNIISYSGQIFAGLVSESFKEKSIQPVSESVGGPILIGSIANTILTSSSNPVLPYLDFVAVISLNLALINILPFPALDGGRFFFLLFEAITKKRVHPDVEKLIHTVGFAILITLVVFVTFSDIKKLI